MYEILQLCRALALAITFLAPAVPVAAQSNTLQLGLKLPRTQFNMTGRVALSALIRNISTQTVALRGPCGGRFEQALQLVVQAQGRSFERTIRVGGEPDATQSTIVESGRWIILQPGEAYLLPTDVDVATLVDQPGEYTIRVLYESVLPCGQGPTAAIEGASAQSAATAITISQ